MKQDGVEAVAICTPHPYYHLLQIDDFLKAILEDGQPLITLEDGGMTVELFTAICRSQRDR